MEAVYPLPQPKFPSTRGAFSFFSLVRMFYFYSCDSKQLGRKQKSGTILPENLFTKYLFRLFISSIMSRVQQKIGDFIESDRIFLTPQNGLILCPVSRLNHKISCRVQMISKSSWE